MAWYSNLIFWRKKEGSSAPATWQKVVAIRGEVTPGSLSVDVATYDANGPTADAGINVILPITKEIRPTVNRLLSGQETEDDHDVLALQLKKFLA